MPLKTIKKESFNGGGDNRFTSIKDGNQKLPVGSLYHIFHLGSKNCYNHDYQDLSI